MWKQGLVVVCTLALLLATGCYAHFDVAATRAAYAASGNDASLQECGSRVVKAQESFNANGRWWSRSVVAGVVLASAISVVAIATGRDTPGDRAMSAGEAVDAERGFSHLELITAALGALAGGDALLAWYSTTKMSSDAKQVADELARCPPQPAPRPAPRPPP